MKKSFFAAMAAIAMLTSCGGGVNLENPESTAKEAMKMAEDSIPAVESPTLGTLPSLCDQLMLARKDLNMLYSDAHKEKLKHAETQDDLVKIMAEYDRNKDAKKAALAIIDKAYKEKCEKAAAELINKEIPAEFDPAQYSAAKVVVKEINVDDKGNTKLVLEATVTPSSKLGAYSNWVSWQYLDANGNEIGGGSSPILDKVEIGKPVVVPNLGPSMKYFNTLEKIKFVKD